MKKLSVFLSLTVLLPVPSILNAATLTAVPMQGGMAMPMVSYSGTEGRIHVIMPTTNDVPQLTPLLHSNPGDNFDAADPWFDALDPSRQGASFSRRYGFVMDSITDALPIGTQMWIRKLSGSSELHAYQYAANPPKAFEPIFGTDGVTNAMSWNGMMFHPTFAAPPGTNALSAVFEVYLVDTTTGSELTNTSSGPLVFDWSNISDGRPLLTLASNITVAWPVETTTNWILESASSPTAAAWSVVTNPTINLEGKPCVVIEVSSSAHYFRMRYLP